MELLIYTEPVNSLKERIEKFAEQLETEGRLIPVPPEDLHSTLFRGEIGEQYKGNLIGILTKLSEDGRPFIEKGIKKVKKVDEGSLILELEGRGLMSLHNKILSELGRSLPNIKGVYSEHFRHNYNPHITIGTLIGGVPQFLPSNLIGWQGWVNYFNLAVKEGEEWKKVETFGFVDLRSYW